MYITSLSNCTDSCPSHTRLPIPKTFEALPRHRAFAHTPRLQCFSHKGSHLKSFSVSLHILSLERQMGRAWRSTRSPGIHMPLLKYQKNIWRKRSVLT